MKLTPIPIGYSSYARSVAEEPPIALENRFFEKNPTNQENQSALIARLGFRKWLNLGSAPIDAIYTQPGSFQDSLFVATGSVLKRVTTAEAVTSVSGSIFNSLFGGVNGAVTVKMAATARIGGTPEYLWAADGASLFMYADAQSARGTLTATSFAASDLIHIGAVYYQFVTSGLDTGTPLGTAANPWKVLIGGSVGATLANLRGAVNEDGLSGVSYSTATTPHPNVYSFNTGTTLEIYSRAMSTVGNSVTTAKDSGGAGLTFSGATLTGGGSPGTARVLMPDDIPPTDVAFIAGYVIVVCSGGYGVNGRFYWINPGEVVIDPLNFATAERSPDPLYGVEVIDDQFWLMGVKTTEIWYPTGDFGTPFQRLEGKLFNRGIWPGSSLKIKDDIMVIDQDGVVYQIAGSPKRVSDNGIEEFIRKSFSAQRIAGTVLRTWTFSQDGHDFYLVYLPLNQTLVYDLTTESWSLWKSSGLGYLNQHTGLNWMAAGSVTYGRGWNSNVVAGDLRSNGTLWIGDPTRGYDETAAAALEAFTCKVTGGIEVAGRETIQCYGVYVEGSMGNPKGGTGVNLSTSDDNGNTWVDQGSLTVTATDYGAELAWRNLGRINKPGRLFRVTDPGALQRINSLEMRQTNG